MITNPPSHQTVNASSTVTFNCDATTDLEEKAHLEIKWLKDGEEINYESERTISLNKRVRFLLFTMKILVTLKILKNKIMKKNPYEKQIFYKLLRGSSIHDHKQLILQGSHRSGNSGKILKTFSSQGNQGKTGVFQPKSGKKISNQGTFFANHFQTF